MIHIFNVEFKSVTLAFILPIGCLISCLSPDIRAEAICGNMLILVCYVSPKSQIDLSCSRTRIWHDAFCTYYISRMTIYKRDIFLSAILTYLLSAIWSSLLPLTCKHVLSGGSVRVVCYLFNLPFL